MRKAYKEPKRQGRDAAPLRSLSSDMRGGRGKARPCRFVEEPFAGIASLECNARLGGARPCGAAAEAVSVVAHQVQNVSSVSPRCTTAIGESFEPVNAAHQHDDVVVARCGLKRR
jgi:hypothetical protein